MQYTLNCFARDNALLLCFSAGMSTSCEVFVFYSSECEYYSLLRRDTSQFCRLVPGSLGYLIGCILSVE
jgi:hypothetical protein